MQQRASTISRRRLLGGGLAASVGLLAGCRAWPWPGGSPTRPARLGFLALREASDPALQAIRARLAELGWVEGQNITFEIRLASDGDQFPALAAELVALPVDLILVSTGVPAAMAATSTIPIIFLAAGDPIRQGYVSSLARPGGNVTGLSNLQGQAQGKHLQILRDLLPDVSRIMWLADTRISMVSGGLAAVQQLAPTLGLQPLTPDVFDTAGLVAALDLASSARVEALLVTGTSLMVREQARILAFAAAARLPVVAQNRGFAAAGGLSSYAPNEDAMSRRAADLADRILRGAKPADLPVEQPTVFEFVINLRTAQALGRTIPPEVLLQATEVIR